MHKKRGIVLAQSAEQVIGEAGDAFIVELEKEYLVKPVRLVESGVEGEHEEIKVDVRHDPFRAVLDRSRPCYVPGQRVSYFVPFEGDPISLRCTPSVIRTNMPRAKIREKELVFEFEVTNENVHRTRDAFEAELSNVKQWLQDAAIDIEVHNQRLGGLLKHALSMRRQQLEQSAQQIQALGIPIRKRTAAPQSEQQHTRGRGTEPKSRCSIQEYDVALSFAGEEREYVEEVASLLKAAGIKVFYDKFETVQLWGRNLADHLGEIYGKRSRFVVMFISKNYPHKGWPTHERQSAQARAIKENEVILLPARFDDTEIPGLPATTGYIDLRRVTLEELAELIKQKLAE